MSGRAQIRTTADFGYQLREERERRGLTQRELATRAGVSPRWLSNFERGKSPRAELIKVVHLARALQLTFELTEERPREIPPSQQALIDAFKQDSLAQQITPALANALAQLSRNTREAQAAGPALLTAATTALDTLQVALRQNPHQLPSSVLTSLAELSAGIEASQAHPNPAAVEEHDGEA